MCKERGLYIKTGNQRELDGVRLGLLKNYFLEVLLICRIQCGILIYIYFKEKFGQGYWHIYHNTNLPFVIRT